MNLAVIARCKPLVALGLALSLSACLSLPHREADLPELPTPAGGYPSSDARTKSAEPPTVVWWQAALAKPLAARLEAALVNNADLAVAQARVAAARASLDSAEAERWGEVGLNGRVDLSNDDGSTAGSRRLGLDATLPLDLFGRLEASRDAAAFDLAQALADLEQVRIDQAEQFLSRYLDAAEAVRRVGLIEEQIEAGKTLLRLTELRFAQGQASSVDVLQQRDELARQRQELPILRFEQRAAANELTRIAGLPPQADIKELLPADLPEVAPNFALDQPLALLNRRPDLIAARADLMARDRRFAAAIANRLPELDLSASALVRATAGDVSGLVNAALDAGFTLFDSGAKRAEIERQRALLQAAGQAYLSAWLTAVAQVDDLLAEEQSLRQRLELSRQRLDVANKLLEAVTRRYQRGISDYLPVLAGLRSLQQQERDHLALQAELARVRVRLHGALGLPSGLKKS